MNLRRRKRVVTLRLCVESSFVFCNLLLYSSNICFSYHTQKHEAPGLCCNQHLEALFYAKSTFLGSINIYSPSPTSPITRTAHKYLSHLFLPPPPPSLSLHSRVNWGLGRREEQPALSIHAKWVQPREQKHYRGGVRHAQHSGGRQDDKGSDLGHGRTGALQSHHLGVSPFPCGADSPACHLKPFSVGKCFSSAGTMDTLSLRPDHLKWGRLLDMFYKT